MHFSYVFFTKGNCIWRKPYPFIRSIWKQMATRMQGTFVIFIWFMSCHKFLKLIFMLLFNRLDSSVLSTRWPSKSVRIFIIPKPLLVWKWKLLSHVQLSSSPWLYSPWNSPGQNTGAGSLSLLQGIFPTQGSNPDLPHCRQILCQLSHKGNPLTCVPAQN